MHRLRWIAPLLVLAALVGCGPSKSVFPPAVSIQQLETQPDGSWKLTLRIQNNSYTGMDFTAIDGRLAVAGGVPVRLHGDFQRDIPALAGDVVGVTVLPTPAMTAALQASAAKGSAGAVPYTLAGTATAARSPDGKPKPYDFSGKDWLSPVPGIAHTWR